jgi:hypothetical protein
MCSASAVAAVGPGGLGGLQAAAHAGADHVGAPRHDHVGVGVGHEGAERGLVAAHRLLQQGRVEPQRRLRLPEAQLGRKHLL